MILGRSGSGKSALALQMMALGAGLIADDRTVLSVEHETLVADAPEAISGMIEARGVGILRAKAVGPTTVVLAVDLDRREEARLPETRVFEVLGCSVPLLGAVAAPHFPASLIQMLAYGRHSP